MAIGIIRFLQGPTLAPGIGFFGAACAAVLIAARAGGAVAGAGATTGVDGPGAEATGVDATDGVATRGADGCAATTVMV